LDKASGSITVAVNPNKLDLEPRRAYVELLQKFGEARLTQMLVSLMMPVPGLAPNNTRLDVPTQLKLAKIIFNEPSRATIQDLGEREAEKIIGQSLGALVLLQMGLLPSSREVFAAMRQAFEHLQGVRRTPASATFFL
jgi:hypothetical protein